MVRDNNIGYANSNKGNMKYMWECIAQSIENNMIKDKVNIYYNIDKYL